VFNKNTEKLIIVGKGTKEIELKAMANPTKITFKKNISTKELAELYSNCKAFIFPQYEDYGLTALEANASGRPVIGFNKGGILDTQIPYQTGVGVGDATAILFDEQNETSLQSAITQFEDIQEGFNPDKIRLHAESFSEELFVKSIQKFR
jgi:glycosyltransferase involved in cell wall biosynthesis